MGSKIIKDSISKGGLRLTTIEAEVYGVDIIRHLNDPMITFSIPEMASVNADSCKVLMTSAHWPSVLSRWRRVPDRFCVLAEQIDTLLFKSTPEILEYGYWHLPFITEEDAKSAMYLALKNREVLGIESPEAALVESVRLLTRVSASRCARIWWPRYDILSPLEVFSMDLDYYADMEDGGADQLGAHQEHVQCVDYISDDAKHWLNPTLHGKFKGWITYRLVAPVESWHADAA